MNTSFSELYTLYFTPIYRYIYFRVDDKADADDLAQDVFVRGLAAFKSGAYADKGKTPLAYFYTIARNLIIDFYKKKKVPIVTEEEEDRAADDTVDDPQEAAIKIEDAAELRKKIAQLSDDQQDVIILRFMDERTTAEIAETMGKTEESVRQIQSRGLSLLKKQFAK